MEFVSEKWSKAALIGSAAYKSMLFPGLYIRITTYG